MVKSEELVWKGGKIMANFDYENKYWWEGKEVVVGIDEAGRGPIAGPLVIGICVFPPFYDNYEINDSKQLTDRKRRKLLEIIKRDAIYYSYEVISVEEVENKIDKYAKEYENSYINEDNQIVEIRLYEVIDIYALFDLMFVVMQRYNRSRILRFKSKF